MNFFDIETGPLPEADLLAVMPEFEAAANLKDPVKIAENIAQKKRAWMEGAALHPETGRVVAIGIVMGDDQFMIIADDDEEELLRKFWRLVGAFPGSDAWLGWNIFNFDLPFLVRRSWFLGVPVPAWLRNGRFWHDLFIDLMVFYGLGVKGYSAKLDTAAKALQVGGKNGDGAMFATLWNGPAEDRAKAVEYLANDLHMTRGVALRIIG